MNPEEVLDNVICARAHNSEQQMELLSEAAALMSDSRYSHSLLCFSISLFVHFVISLLLHVYYYCSIAVYFHQSFLFWPFLHLFLFVCDALSFSDCVGGNVHVSVCMWKCVCVYVCARL